MIVFRTDPLSILAVLLLLIVFSEWLSRRGPFRYFGSALIVILLGAIVANLGVIPAGSTPDAPVPVYGAIFTYLAPIGIFWLLLQVNLRDVLRAGLPLIALFLLGSIGTLAGAVLGMRVVRGAETIGPLYQAIAGMFTGTYIGAARTSTPSRSTTTSFATGRCTAGPSSSTTSSRPSGSSRR